MTARQGFVDDAETPLVNCRAIALCLNCNLQASPKVTRERNVLRRLRPVSRGVGRPRHAFRTRGETPVRKLIHTCVARLRNRLRSRTGAMARVEVGRGPDGCLGFAAAELVPERTLADPQQGGRPSLVIARLAQRLGDQVLLEDLDRPGQIE